MFSLIIRVDWALLPLPTCRSVLVLLAGNCLPYHQPESLATIDSMSAVVNVSGRLLLASTAPWSRREVDASCTKFHLLWASLVAGMRLASDRELLLASYLGRLLHGSYDRWDQPSAPGGATDHPITWRDGHRLHVS